MKTFNHKRPIRDDLGNKIAEYDAPVSRVTVKELGGQFGLHKRNRLVVTLKAGDVIEMRPERTRQVVAGTAVDMYRFLLRCQANRGLLEKARLAKERKKERRERGRIARADARLRKELRSEQ